jgi:hypothetical protein
MYRVRQQDLPYVGSSHQFVGADHGDVNVSVFLLSALPGNGPGPHRHPCQPVVRVLPAFDRRCIPAGGVAPSSNMARYSQSSRLAIGAPRRSRCSPGLSPRAARPLIRAEADCPGHWPAGGCQSSTLFPSGSMTQANFPYSESSIFSRTLQPSSRKTLTRAWRSSTR